MPGKIYDITRSISPSTAVWPGDLSPHFRWSAEMEEGSSVNVGFVQLSTHTGTHVDAPLHYEVNGASVDDYPLNIFVGEALLIDLHLIDMIRAEHLTMVSHGMPRLLVRTRQSSLADNDWTDDIAYFDPDAIDFLAERGVRLIGTDAPSFDPVHSTLLPAHHALARQGIANIENLQLAGVPSGKYDLVALPMKLVGMDAAPVRAILIDRV